MTPSSRLPLTAHAKPLAGTRWAIKKLLEWLFLSALPVIALWQFKPQLMLFWRWLLSSWAPVLGLSTPTHWMVDNADALQRQLLHNNAGLPSVTQVAVTAMGVGIFWLASGLLSDRFHPLKIAVRVLCLIQGSACLFFAWVPESFPYTTSGHLNTLLLMGYGFMLAIGPMLALGWGVLNVPWLAKVLMPFLFLAFFAVMLPHKALLHIWLLEHFSILFMPVLFLLFGTLLELWIFVALYALLTSWTPTLTTNSAQPGALT